MLPTKASEAAEADEPLATSIARIEHRLNHANERILKLQGKATAGARGLTEDELDENREAYMMGSAPALYVLMASSARRRQPGSAS